MNQRITELQLRHAARELLRSAPGASGREFRRQMREHRGVAGNTTRIFAIWREEQAQYVDQVKQASLASVPERAAFAALELRTVEAEAQALTMRDRAERAELREEAHQDHWAMEVDRLREQLRQQPNFAAEVRRLQTRVTQLTVENTHLRAALQHIEGH